MIEIRPASSRGHVKIDWLDSWHSFSFGDYHDPTRVNWGPLRVINEDRVAPGAGFPTHAHRDMEIITWVLDGALAHKDSTGGAETIRPGELQRMTAGTGIRHSEYNASPTAPVHLLQIWLHPAIQNLTPGYEQRSFAAEIDGRLALVAASDGRDGALKIHQDADLWIGHLAAGQTATLAARPGRVQWLQLARGTATLNGHALQPGDGAAISGESTIDFRSTTASEPLIFDMAA